VTRLKWKIVSVRFEIMLILIQLAQKSFWMHLTELVGDVGHVESCFGLFGHSVSFDARGVHGLHQMYHGLTNHFGRTGWNSLVTRLKWKLVSVHLEIVLILIRDRCTVCAEHIIGLEIILDAPNGTTR
jgi:hypothetical protein